MRVAVFLVLSIAACEPDYRDTAFRCDDAHGCPAEQSCVHGRCRRGGVVGRVQCDNTECTETEQCCSSGGAGTRCIPAGEICDGKSALCDGLDDCQSGDACCAGDTAACGASCPEDETQCTTDDDCSPGVEPFCCDTGQPWKRCRSSSC